ncbi:MAG: MFS transporter, partial [Rubrivivax sp.]
MAPEFTARDGLRYGALGLPLAFVALPLYVHLPAHYATRFGLPLASLGALLLLARALDAVVDPWLGRLCDRALGRGSLGWPLAAAAVLLVAGFAGLFFPPVQQHPALLAWAGAGLVITYLAYSGLSVLHQAWGARLGGSAARQSRVVAWREGFALVGVVSASLLPSLAGFGATTLALAVTLAAG